MQEMWVQSLGWADPLQEGMATHSSILACKIPWTEEPGRLQSMGLLNQTPLRHQITTKRGSSSPCPQVVPAFLSQSSGSAGARV